MPTKRTGIHPLSYLGVEAPQPPNIIFERRAPTVNDYLGFNTGDIWVDNSSEPLAAPTSEDVWMLVSKNKAINNATWVNFSSGSGVVESLTGDTGGPVFPDANDNTNILSGIAGLTVDGNPATNTLTLNSSGGGGLFQTLTGDAGGAVFPDGAGNINTLGTAGRITTTGNPGTNTITWNLDASIAEQYTTDAGVAVPVANNLNVFGGTAGRDINTTGVGDTVRVELNNAITIGDLANLGAGVAAVTATTGDITLSATNNVGNINLPSTHSSGNAGVITSGGTGGANRLISNFGSDNVFVGFESGNFTVTGNNNSSIGAFTLQDLTTGSENTAMGRTTLRDVTTGSRNSCIGSGAGQAITTGDNNTAQGNSSLFFLTTGSFNTVLGESALTGPTTGSYNVSIGYLSGSGGAVAGDSSNVFLGSLGAAGSNAIYIGNDGSGNSQQNRCFIAGIRGVTTGVADAIAVLIDSAHQLGTLSSSIRYKTNVKDLGSDSGIIYDLRPVSFNYRKHPEVPAWGLIAEDVETVFPQLVVYDKDGQPDSVKYHDLPVLLLNELQKLNKRVEDLEKELESCTCD